jgi:hypothetical protein
MHVHEILCSLAIAGVIASTQIDSYEITERELKMQLARVQLVQIGKALSIDNIQKNRLPSEKEFPGWLIARLEGLEDVKNDHDPWGTSLCYTRNQKGFRLVSAGPDGAFGTEDDIRYE